MTFIGRALLQFARDEGGQDIIEYGMLAALVALAVLAIVLAFGDPLSTLYRDVILAKLTSAAATVSH